MRISDWSSDVCSSDLRYAAPAPELREFISTYYLFRADLSDIADSTRADLPQIRFMLSGRGHYTFGHGSKAKCQDAMATGTTTSDTRITPKGPRVAFSIGLLPSGQNAEICGRASEKPDHVEEARTVLGNFSRALLQQ